MAKRKLNKGLSTYQSFMKKAKRGGATHKQALRAWKQHKAAKRKAVRAPRAGRSYSTGAKYRAKRESRESELAHFEKMQARLARREKAKARLKRIKEGQAERPRRERYAAAKREASLYGVSDFPAYESWTGRDPGGRKKGKKKGKAKKKVSSWNKFMAKHRRQGMSMKAIGRLWRKSGLAKPKAKAKGKKKAAKRDPGWFKHPRLHGKAAHKGWLRHKRAGRDPGRSKFSTRMQLQGESMREEIAAMTTPQLKNAVRIYSSRVDRGNTYAMKELKMIIRELNRRGASF